jgi:hypothetical protein
MKKNKFPITLLKKGRYLSIGLWELEKTQTKQGEDVIYDES